MIASPKLVTGEAEMLAYGAAIAATLPKRALLFLEGNVGAGKTTLTKGIVQGLGAASADEVCSPTFTLIHEYGEPVRVYHIDLYRIDEPRQLFTLGLDEIFDRQAVVLIEWPERFRHLLPKPDLILSIEHAGEGRLVSIRDSREGL